MKISAEHIKLVSLHIPKTAGTSFRTILEERFGKPKVLHFDIYASGSIHAKRKPFDRNSFRKKTAVLHGHFSYTDLHNYVKLPQDVAMITWLRHPVDRVVSNYHFLNEIIAKRLKELPDENLMSRMGRSLLEFAEQTENQNVMSRFLKGSDLSRFKFIGIQDHFEEELVRLERIMNWPPIVNRIHNATERLKLEISTREYEQIALLNQGDMMLFEQACHLRNQTLSTDSTK